MSPLEVAAWVEEVDVIGVVGGFNRHLGRSSLAMFVQLFGAPID